MSSPRNRQNDADLAKNLILATSPLPQTPIQLDGHEEDIDEPNEDNLNNSNKRLLNFDTFDQVQVSIEDKRPLQLPSSGEGPGGPQLIGTDIESQATLRLKKMKEGQLITDKLTEARARFDRKMAILDTREKANKTKKDDLETMLKNLQPLIDDNDRKVGKARARLSAETASRAQVDAEVARLYDEIEKTKNDCINFEIQSRQMQQNSKFLNQVVILSNKDAKGLHFSSVSDLLTRHTTFLQTNKDLSLQADHAANLLETFRNQASHEISMGRTHQLDLTSRLERIRARIEILNRESAELDGIEEAQLDDAEENMRQWTATTNAIVNLFKRVDATTPRGAALGLEVQLDSFKKVDKVAKTCLIPQEMSNKLTMMSARLGDMLSMVKDYPMWVLQQAEERRLKEEKIAEEEKAHEKMLEDARAMEEAQKNKNMSSSNSASASSSNSKIVISKPIGSTSRGISRGTIEGDTEESLMGLSGGSAGSGARAVRAARARPGSALSAAPPVAISAKTSDIKPLHRNVSVSSSSSSHIITRSKGLSLAAPTAHNVSLQVDAGSKKAYKLKENVYKLPFSIDAENISSTT